MEARLIRKAPMEGRWEKQALVKQPRAKWLDKAYLCVLNCPIFSDSEEDIK